MKKLIWMGLLGSLTLACNYRPTEQETVKQGVARIAADESLKPLVDAQVAAYQTHYPDATFEVTYVPEQRAVNLLLKDSADVAITTRELQGKELEYYTKTKIPYQPARMALDAVALVMAPGSARTTITLDELKAVFDGKSNYQLVFDNSNSSNLAFLKQRLEITTTDKAQIAAANGNLDVFDYVRRNPNSIGVVGNNWISDEDDPRAVALRGSVRVLNVSADGKNFFEPTLANLQQRQYPLERLVYLHTNTTKWKVPKGFIRFACSKVGQLVVEKMGLLPYYVIPHEYMLNNKPLRSSDINKQK